MFGRSFHLICIGAASQAFATAALIAIGFLTPTATQQFAAGVTWILLGMLWVVWLAWKRS
jgi:hypothetical protein